MPTMSPEETRGWMMTPVTMVCTCVVQWIIRDSLVYISTYVLLDYPNILCFSMRRYPKYIPRRECLPTPFSFRRSNGETADKQKNETSVNDGVLGSGTIGKDGGRLAYQPMTDDEGEAKISETQLPSVSLEMAGSKPVHATMGGGHDKGGVDAMKDRPEAGLWGPDGLLAVPHVKMVIFLACLFQVK